MAQPVTSMRPGAEIPWLDRLAKKRARAKTAKIRGRGKVAEMRKIRAVAIQATLRRGNEVELILALHEMLAGISGSRRRRPSGRGNRWI